MSTKISYLVWVLVLCFCFSSSKAFAAWNDYTFNSDIDFYKDSILQSNPDYILTDWQYFPSDGLYQDGDTTNDSFCFPMDTGQGGYIIVYGANGASNCSQWSMWNPNYANATMVNYFDMVGAVKLDCSNPLNDMSCPGYQQAYFQMLCTTNPLYDQSCPGYAQAYAVLLNEERLAEQLASAVDDGTPSNDGNDNADGTDLTAFIEPVVVEQVQEFVEDFSGSDDGSVQEQVVDVVEQAQQVVEQAAAVAGVAVEVAQEANAVAEQEATGVALTDEKIVEQSAATSEPSKEDGPSARDTINRLSAIGVLGNSQTNGVGDATGLSSSIEGTGGTMSLTGQVQDASASNGSGGQQNDGSSSQSTDGMDSGSVFGSVIDSPETMANGNSELETQMGSNLNDMFSDPALQSDVELFSGIGQDKIETLSSRIIKDRINALIEADKDTSVKDAEELVAESIQESIDNKLDDLMTDAGQNQAEIVALMGINIDFDSYKNKKIEEISFYTDGQWFQEVEIPQNRRALRNGLAQQILHDKMVDEQYESSDN